MSFGMAMLMLLAIMVGVFLFAHSLRQKCVNCRGEVELVEKKIVIHPTKRIQGMERTTYKCLSCGHVFHRRKRLWRHGIFNPNTTKRIHEKGDDDGYVAASVQELGPTGYARQAEALGRMPLGSPKMFGGGSSSGGGASASYGKK